MVDAMLRANVRLKTRWLFAVRAVLCLVSAFCLQSVARANIELKYITEDPWPHSKGGIVMDDKYVWLATWGQDLWKMERSEWYAHSGGKVNPAGDDSLYDLWPINSTGNYPSDPDDGYYFAAVGQKGYLNIIDNTNAVRVGSDLTRRTTYSVYATDPAHHKIYVGTDGGVLVYDIADPANPVLTTTISEGANVASVRGAEGYDYVFVDSYADNSLIIVDINTDTVVGSIDVVGRGMGTARRHWVHQGADGEWYDYIISNEGHMWIVNVSDPTDPEIVGFWEAPYISDSWLLRGAVTVSEDFPYAFVVMSTANGQGLLYAVNISDPTNPYMEDYIYNAKASFNDVRVDGSEIHIGSHDGWYLYSWGGWQPDIWASNIDESNYIGDDIYELSASIQIKEQSVVPNQGASYVVKVENDGDLDKLTLAGGGSIGNWDVEYLLWGTNDITAAVTNQGYQSDFMEPGECFLVTVNITPNSSVSSGDSFSVPLDAFSYRSPYLNGLGTKDAAQLTAYVYFPAMSVAKTDYQDDVFPGAPLPYVITYSNTGNIAAYDVTVTDTLPSGVTYISAVPEPASVAGAGGDTVVTWNIGTVPAGAAYSIRLNAGLDASAEAGTLFTNNVELSFEDVEGGSYPVVQDDDVDNVLGSPLIKEVDKAFAVAGEVVTYTITPSYDGVTPLSSVVVTDAVPPGLTFSNANSGGTYGSGRVTWNLGSNTDDVRGVGTVGLARKSMTLQAIKDTFVSKGAPDTADGSDTNLLCGKTSSNIRHDFVQWDLSPIPSAATITNALFRVYVNATPNQNFDADVNGLTTNWTEFGATWNSNGDGLAWSGADGYVGAVEDSFNFTKTVTGWYTVDITPITTNWFKGILPNYGLRVDGSGGNGIYYWDSREGGNAPELIVDYTVPIFATNELHVSPLVATSNDTVTVSMTLSASETVSNMLPSALSWTGTQGITVTATNGPNPATAQHVYPGSNTVFAWTVNVADLGTNGTLYFSAYATNSAGTVTFPTATSEWAIVAPLLQYRAVVNTNPPVTVATNTAVWKDSTIYTNGRPSNPVETQLGSSIGDYVWQDVNGNGLQDEGPSYGLAGVEVTLTTNGVAYVTTVTDANGYYLFQGLGLGTYTVAVNTATLPAPSGMALTTGNDPQVVYMTNGMSSLTNDFGFRYTGEIGDLVWADDNGDGVVDAGESGIPGITVRLYLDTNSNGVVDAGEFLNSYVTDAAGFYSFTNLSPGAYIISADGTDPDMPSGYQATTDNPQYATLGVGSMVNTNIDFGFTDYGSIGDFVWFDADNDGLQDAYEPGMSGIGVVLLDPGGSSNSIVTSAAGFYRFVDLPSGTYTVRVDKSTFPSGFKSTTADEYVVSLTVGQVYTNADFGLGGTGQIGDFVWRDLDGDGLQDGGAETGIANVTVLLYDDVDGNGYLGPTDRLIASNYTAADGTYWFTNVAPGKYMVDVDQYDPEITNLQYGATHAEPVAIDLSPGDVFTNADFGFGPFAQIGYLVWEDLNTNGVFEPVQGEKGLPGWSVVVTGGGVTRTNVTDEYGEYRFYALPATATYTVEVVNVVAGYTNTTANPYVTTVNPGDYDDNANFGFVGTASIGDRVWDDADGDGFQDPGETGLVGVTVWLFKDLNNNGRYDDTDRPGTTLITGADGYYTFSNLASTNYIVRVFDDDPGIPAGYTYTTPEPLLVVLGPGEVYTNADFGFGPFLSIHGSVYVDKNWNSERDTGSDSRNEEDGVSNVTVTLWRDANTNGVLDGPDVSLGTDVTDDYGFYFFGGLTSDWYIVQASTSDIPAGYEYITVNPDAVTNAQSGTSYQVDFGINGMSSIGDLVWLDENRNGEQDESPLVGISNVLVELWYDYNQNGILDPGPGGDQYLRNTWTDTNGVYTFDNLLTDSYFVQVFEDHPVLVQAGYGPTTRNPVKVDVTEVGVAYTNADFGFGPYASIGGLVWYDEDEDGLQDEPIIQGVSNVIVRLYEASQTNWLKATLSGPDGYYSFTGISLAGEYFVEFMPLGYTISPRDQGSDDTVDSDVSTNAPYRTPITTLSLGDSQMTWDLGLYRPAESNAIGDRVWFDTNRDGVQDADESNSVPGLVVSLYIGDTTTVYRTTVTDVEGYYYFEGLPSTNYYLQFGKPSDYFYSPKDFTADDADSDADTVSGFTDVITIGTGETNYTWDCGIYAVLDLGVEKTVNNASPDAGETIWYTITLTNSGPSHATDVLLTDTWPTDIAYGSAVPSQGAYTQSNGVWDVGTVLAGAWATLSITGTVNPGTGGQIITNTIAVTNVGEPDTNSANDVAVALLAVGSLDLAVGKAVDNPTPYEGSNVVFTIAVTNGGPKDATGVVLTDLLPGGVTYVSHVAGTGSYDGVSGLWTIGGLALGNVGTLAITASVDAGTGGTQITNTVSLSAVDQEDLNPNNDTASAVITVVGADLAITKTVDNSAPNEGDDVTYTIVVTNMGPNDATGVEVAEPLTNGLTYVSHVESQGAYDSTTGVWNVGALAVSNGATLTITANVDTGTVYTVITNRSVITASDLPDPDLSNNEAFADIGISDLLISKSSDVATVVYPGSNITYTVIVTNAGSPTHTGVAVSDVVPVGTEYVTNSVQVTRPLTTNETWRDEFNSTAYTNNDGSIDWSNYWQEEGEADGALLGNVQVGADGVYQYVMWVENQPFGAWRQADLSGYKTAELSFDFRRQALDGASDFVAVYASASGGAPWTEVGRIEGTANEGTYISTNIDISAYVSGTTAIRFLSGGLANNEFVFLDNVRIYGEKRIYTTVPGNDPPNVADGYTLESDEYLEVTFEVAVDDPLTVYRITNTATMVSDQMPLPRSATVTDLVAYVDLAVQKIVSEHYPGFDEVVWYRIAVSNKGTVAGTGVELVDYWPAGQVTFSNATPSIGVYDSSNPTNHVWSGFDVGPGGGEMVVITGRINVATHDVRITNVAEITTLNENDINLTNNIAREWVETLVALSRFDVVVEGGRVIVEWETAMEINTAGFYVYRRNGADGEQVKVNRMVVPAVPGSPQGGVYRVIDEGAIPGKACIYTLVEVERSGRSLEYGPFDVLVPVLSGGSGGSGEDGFELGFVAEPRVSEFKKARMKLQKESLEKLEPVHPPVILGGTGGDGGASLQQVKIKVQEDGVYYVGAAETAVLLGVPVFDIESYFAGGLAMLKNNGVEVAYLAAGGGEGIYFFGESMDSIYTKENVYWLEWGPGTPVVPASGQGPASSPGGTFGDVLHFEQDVAAAPAFAGSAEDDYWFWDYILSGHATLGIKSYEVSLPGVAAMSTTAVVNVWLHGATTTGIDPEHHAVVSVNGTLIGEHLWSGMGAMSISFEFDQAILSNGVNTVGIEGVLEPGVPHSILYLDSMDVAYQRDYMAVGDQLVVRGDGNDVVTVDGFSTNAVHVVSMAAGALSNEMAVTVESTVNGYSVSFAPAGPDVPYAVFGAGAGRSPWSLTADIPSDLKAVSNSADYLVITVPEFRAEAETLAAYRNGKGLATRVIMLEDVYDEFSHGIENPATIRDFLGYACRNWTKLPLYVVLAGEGTYDYKGITGGGENFVPPMMVMTPHGLFASDGWFADVNEDGVPEVAIGRLPVITGQEFADVTAKIIGYEASAPADWQTTMLLVSDDPDRGGDFSASSSAAEGLVDAGWDRKSIRLSDYAPGEAHDEFVAALNEGSAFVNYFGHAGTDKLSDNDLFRMADVGLLTNSSCLPILTAMTCVMGRFPIPANDCLAEAMLLKKDGGAVAVWAPTGLSLNEPAQVLDQEFYRSIFEEQENVIGEAVVASLRAYREMKRTRYLTGIYNLLGDPATVIAGRGGAGDPYANAYRLPLETWLELYFSETELLHAWIGGTTGDPDDDGVLNDSERMLGNSPRRPDPLLPIHGWKALYFSESELDDFLLSGSQADADGDGILNIVEYALAMHPRVVEPYPVMYVDANLPPEIETHDAVLTYRRNIDAWDVSFLIEVSGDLASWRSGATFVVGSEVTDDGNGLTETVRVFVRAPGDGGKCYMRLRVGKR